MVDAPNDWTVREVSIQQRLADIERRLGELRHDWPVRPDRGRAAELLSDAQRHVREADQHLRESTARTQAVRQLVAQAYQSAARAHDHAAEAHERSVRAGVGNVAEHKRMAEFHRAAAEADRQQRANLENHGDLLTLEPGR